MLSRIISRLNVSIGFVERRTRLKVAKCASIYVDRPLVCNNEVCSRPFSRTAKKCDDDSIGSPKITESADSVVMTASKAKRRRPRKGAATDAPGDSATTASTSKAKGTRARRTAGTVPGSDGATATSPLTAKRGRPRVAAASVEGAGESAAEQGGRDEVKKARARERKIAELKKTALLQTPRKLPYTGLQLYVSEKLKGSTYAKTGLGAVSGAFRGLSVSDKEVSLSVRGQGRHQREGGVCANISRAMTRPPDVIGAPTRAR